jgi:uncharacterized membrane-anchored protein YitT (DUF2179 family)
MNWRRFTDYIGIAIGSAIVALGLDMFLIPNKIAAGGVSGIATILYYIINSPVGVTMLIINIPLFIISIKELGINFGIRSLFGTIVVSFFIDFLAKVVPVGTSNLLLASLYGGLLSGLGLGIVFRSKGTTGGTDLAAALFQRFTNISIGKGLFAIDGCVIVAAGIFFGIEEALYALITVFVTSRVIDIVQEGVSYARAAIIISDHSPAIAKEILAVMDRGVTSLKGAGVFTGADKEVLLSVVTRAEVTRLKELVYDVDNKAFVIITDVHEVLGEGFKRRL